MNHIKPTLNEHPVLDIIKNRWSIRAFRDEAVSEQEMNSLFEAARWAASAANEQPWQYVYAHKGTGGHMKIGHCLMPGNQPWAINAAVMLVCIVRKTFEASQKENPGALHDLGMANANLLTQAFSMGIYCHPMGGFDRVRLKEELGLTDDQQLVCVIALGYPAAAGTLEEPYKSRELGERVRKPIAAFVREI